MSTGYRDLLVWQEAMSLAVVAYRVTSRFPKEETYGLTAQIRKSAISIPSNIAEGSARNSPRELYQFLGIAAGSLAEVETQLELGIRLEYLTQHSRASASTESWNAASRTSTVLRAGLSPVKQPGLAGGCANALSETPYLRRLI